MQPSLRDPGFAEPVPLRVGPVVSVWAFATVLLQNRRLIVATALAVAFVTGVVSFLSRRQYVASASFVPQEPPSVQGGLSQLASQFGLTAGRASTSSPQFYADLLQSRELLRSLSVTDFSLAGTPPFRGNLLRYFEIEPRNPDEATAAVIRVVRGRLAVRTDNRTGVVSFEVFTPSPDLSARLVDRLLELVNEYNLLRRQSQGRAEREFVEQRLALAQAALTRAEDSLALFLRRNRRFQDSPQLVAEEARLQRSVQVRQQVYMTLSQGHESAKIEEVRDTPLITVLGRPEGFVEKKARGTVRKALVALMLGAFLGVGLALTREHVRRLAERGDAGYLEFLGVLGNLRGAWRRRVARRADA